MKALHGAGASLALAMLFWYSGVEEKLPSREKADSLDIVATEIAKSLVEKQRFHSVAVVPAAPSGNREALPASSRHAVDGEEEKGRIAQLELQAALAPLPVFSDTVSTDMAMVPPAMTAPPLSPAAFASAPAPVNIDANGGIQSIRDTFFEHSSGATSGRDASGSASSAQRAASLFSGVRSASAFASMQPSGQPPPAACTDTPPKGLRLWGSLGYVSATQKDISAKRLAPYTMKETGFSLGFDKDWSVSTILGLSLDVVKSDISSKFTDVSYKNDVTNYMLNGHIATTLGKFSVKGRVGYGFMSTTGSGTVFGAARQEDSHKGTMLNAAIETSIPLKFGDDIKLEPKAGFEYTSIRSDAYSYRQGATTFNVTEFSSSSLRVPLLVEVKKEFAPCMGLVTVKGFFGLVHEFQSNGAGVLARNAAAGASDLNSIFGELPSNFYRFGLALNSMSHGGWIIDLNYHYDMVKGGLYNSHNLRLELGKNF